MGNDLGMQYIMDGNGNYYRVNGKDQLVIAGCREEASVFTFFEANQRIGGGKKAKFYQTIPVDAIDNLENEMIANDPVYSKVISILDKGAIPTEEAPSSTEQVYEEAKPEAPTQRNNVKKAELEYDIAGIDWLDYMNLFCYLSNTVKDYQEEMGVKHSKVEKEICDLLHYIELYDLSDEEAVMAVDMLKDARQRRRDIKDDIMRAELFQRSIGTSANVAKAKGCIKELNKLETRVYHPRELSELFEGMEDRETDREAYREEQSNCVKSEIPVRDAGDRERDTWEEESGMEYVRRDTIYDGQKNDWLGLAKAQLDFFTNIEQYMINLELDLDALDLEIEEILTIIEDANYNVTQGYKAFKKLKELRNERKEKLRELEQLQAITGGFDCVAMVEAYRDVVEAVEEMAVSTVEENEVMAAEVG